MTTFRLEVRRSRGLMVWLGITLLAYGGLMGLMHPVLAQNDELMKEYLKVFPEGFMAAFGMTGTLSDPGVFFTTYIGSWLWPIVAAVGGLLLGTRAVAADLDRGFLDLPLATRTSRVRYLAASIWGQVLVMAVLATCAVVGLWTVGTIVGAPFDLVRFAGGGVLCFAFGCAIAGPATLISVLTLSRGMTSAIVGGVLLAMYGVFVVTQVADDWAWLAPLSAWHHFAATAWIDNGQLPATGLALYALFAIGGWLAALWAFSRRDLAA